MSIEYLSFLKKYDIFVELDSQTQGEKLFLSCGLGFFYENMFSTDKIKHLELVQLIITRMAGSSFLLKGWTVSLVVAVIALGVKDSNFAFVLLGYIPCFSFWLLDAYYLRQERLFRKLYDGVRVSPKKYTDFSMNTKPYASKVSYWEVLLSPTLKGFYVPVIVIILIVTFIWFLSLRGGVISETTSVLQFSL